MAEVTAEKPDERGINQWLSSHDFPDHLKKQERQFEYTVKANSCLDTGSSALRYGASTITAYGWLKMHGLA